MNRKGQSLLSAILWFAALALANYPTMAQAPATGADVKKALLTLEDLYSDYNIVDADISPSGKFIAATVRKGSDDVIVLVDLTTGQKSKITHINKDAFGKDLDVHMGFVVWKTDERLLFQIQSRANEGLSFDHMSTSNVFKLGDRLFAVNRDGSHLVPMFGEKWDEALVGAFDTSDIASILSNDPQHILIRVGGWDGRSLFKVDVQTGVGKIVEKQSESVIDWWFDVNGNAIGRVEYSAGTLRYYRKTEDGKWKKYYSVRRRDMGELPDFEGIGPSNDPDKFYVRARPPGKDRMGIYLYDLQKEEFGEPLAENPTYDVVFGRISQDGTKVLYHCYDVHVRTCDFADPKMTAYMRGLRKFFDETANVYVVDASDDGKILLLSVDGPSDPPAFYFSVVANKKVELLGLRQGAMADKAVPLARIVSYKARDGKDETGYLTFPPGARDAKKLPLVLMPHGGPQARDRLEFDPWVQYLAARGYAVFQPNFRGSDGFGEAFAASGHREWGRKMQNDLDDGVKMLVDEGTVDPARVCIFGASYGGYAALAGATLTPDAYKCAVSLAGISDLEKLARSERKKYGADSERFAYVARAIGDPDKDQASLREVSPAYHIDAIKIPILLIHGDADDTVPYSQSEDMKKLLDKSGRKTTLLRLKKEGHGGFEDNTSKVVLSAIGVFLWDNLGPGYGVTDPPEKYVFEK